MTPLANPCRSAAAGHDRDLSAPQEVGDLPLVERVWAPAPEAAGQLRMMRRPFTQQEFRSCSMRWILRRAAGKPDVLPGRVDLQGTQARQRRTDRERAPGFETRY